MKSISVVDSLAIRNHPLNNSSSKNAFQFPKTQRFPSYNPQCKVAFYCNDSQLSQRRASFGYGQKHDFTRNTTSSPPPTKYDSKSLFDESKNKGKSFGQSRQKSPDQSYLIPQLQKIPGPGQYNNQKNKKSNYSFTMRSRVLDVQQQQKSFKMNPGPDHYKQIDLNPKSGRFTVGKFGDSKYSKISPNGERFEKIKESPGPFSYKDGENLSNRGKYILSGHQGNGTRAFGQTARTTFTDQFRKTSSKLPGPGNYESPTEFGIYGDSKYYKTLAGFKTIQ